LARHELRDACWDLVCARSRIDEAETARDKLEGEELRIVESLEEQAKWTAGQAEETIVHTLLMIWGAVADFDEATGNVGTPPWEPCGAHVEGFIVWIEPTEDDGSAAFHEFLYDPGRATVRLIDLATTGEDEAEAIGRVPSRLVRFDDDSAHVLKE
jgi:hypothetical protein